MAGLKEPSITTDAVSISGAFMPVANISSASIRGPGLRFPAMG